VATVAEDRDAIRDLLARYCLYADTGAVDEWVELYTEDGRFEGHGDPVVGRDALRGLASSFAGSSVHRVATNEVIDVSRDSAVCRSSIILTADGAIVMTGRVHDELRRVSGGWRIARRRFTPDPRSAATPDHRRDRGTPR
jgi:ketosteroid isomerase-like protein